LSAVLAEVTAL